MTPLWREAEYDFRFTDRRDYPCRYIGPERKLSAINTVVIHRLVSGKGDAGLRYFANPGKKRQVSAHCIIHHDGYHRPYTKLLPLSRVAWHCPTPREELKAPKYPHGMNYHSIGVEFDGVLHKDAITPRQMETLTDLLYQWRHDLAIPITDLGSHEYYDQFRTAKDTHYPKSDPGREFDWKHLVGLNLNLCFKKE